MHTPTTPDDGSTYLETLLTTLLDAEFARISCAMVCEYTNARVHQQRVVDLKRQILRLYYCDRSPSAVERIKFMVEDRKNP